MQHTGSSAALLATLLVLSGCHAIAEFAYDAGAMEEAKRCETLTSHPERQSCLARVRQAEMQASELRKRN
jgi:hypothetical protein